jgi:hypothetical protein
MSPLVADSFLVFVIVVSLVGAAVCNRSAVAK